MIFVCRAMWRAADRALPVGLLRLMLPLLLPRRVIAVGGFTSASVALLSVVPGAVSYAALGSSLSFNSCVYA